MKILEFDLRIKKIIKNLRFHSDNYEKHENHIIQIKNHENHENLKIALKNHENHENH